MIVDLILGAGMLACAVMAVIYREQRDNLAAAWVYFHPEDFPDQTNNDD